MKLVIQLIMFKICLSRESNWGQLVSLVKNPLGPVK